MPGPAGERLPGGRLPRATVYHRGQELVDEGLRILARMIARSYLRDQNRCTGNGPGNPGENPINPIEESDSINLNMEQ
jgi:hypothetical protein